MAPGSGSASWERRTDRGELCSPKARVAGVTLLAPRVHRDHILDGHSGLAGGKGVQGGFGSVFRLGVEGRLRLQERRFTESKFFFLVFM